MPVEFAQLLVDLVAIYSFLGVFFAAFFVVFGVHRLDANAQQGSWGFRLLILPGVILFWPLFAWRLMRGINNPPTERTRHRCAAVDLSSGRDKQ